MPGVQPQVTRRLCVLDKRYGLGAPLLQATCEVILQILSDALQVVNDAYGERA
jgi:hypothetical protein